MTFASELRVQVTPDGRVWAASGFGHDYWSTLLGVETRATLLARSESVGSTPEVTDRVDGPLVNVVCLPPIRPGRDTLANSMSALRTTWSLESDGALLLIMPGTVASLALVIAILRRRSFCVWVVGDPIDVAFKAGVGGPGGKPAGLLLAGTTRLACRRAAVVSYVTSEYLQQRYPPGPQSTSLSLSSARLGGELHSSVRAWERPVARIATVGSLAQRYKRVDLLLDALAWLRREGWDLQLDVVGGGRLLPELVSQAKALGIDGWITFHGAVPQTKVRSVLANADLFVLCSDTEGLPHAVVEAMSLGLPCIGSSVGGIPELLPAVARFEQGSLDSLISALRRFLVSPQLRRTCGTQALERAAAYHEPARAPAVQAFADAVAKSCGG